jgi:hypothetical protein
MELVEMTKKEYDDYMVKKYPDIFRERKLTIHESCMAWGFDIGPGWYQLVDDLCKCLVEIQKVTGIEIIAKQVKEKFGTLRFYISYTLPDGFDSLTWWEIIYGIIDAFEQKSSQCCERCGKLGSLRDDGWITTLCDEHYEEWLAERRGV